MSEVDDECHGSDEAISGLTAEQKAARREIIKRSAEKAATIKRLEAYYNQKCYLKDDVDYRELQELIELGISPANALRLSERNYKRGTFHELEDYWWLLV
ncbi:MAG: hypothetical protein EG822_16385 [Deltaproteobacteria bacterium]|nr:hypothetical protein [Deltaproteobacteria bacterium]TLN00966.1 MAG: hypothetical protein FDZ73_17655 [bacterium]